MADGFPQYVADIFRPLILYNRRINLFYTIFNQVHNLYQQGQMTDAEANIRLNSYRTFARDVNVIVNINQAYVNDWMMKYNNYKRVVPEKLDFLVSSMEILNNLFNVTTEKINTIDDTNVNKWGGGIRYDPASRKLIKYDGTIGLNYPRVGDAGYQSINVFFNHILPRLEFRLDPAITWIFRQDDLRRSKIMGAGSFGYGLRIKCSRQTNPLQKKNMMIKIIPFTRGAEDGTLEINKESFIPFKLSKIYDANRAMINYNVFNENYLIFNFSNVLNQQDYTQKLLDNFTFNQNDIDNYYLQRIFPQISDDNKARLRSGNIGYVLMSGGIGDISDIYRYTLAIFNNDSIALRNLSNVPEQLLNVHSLCYRDRNNTIYITHNDIKPGNMIFEFDGNIKTKIIDHGANLFSTNFFNLMRIFTPPYRNAVTFNDCEITSPLFDLVSVLYSILQTFLYNRLPDFYNRLNLDNLTRAGRRGSTIVARYFSREYFEIIYKALETINPLADLTLAPTLIEQEVIHNKAILAIKLLEVMNLFFAIKNYYLEKIRPQHDEMVNDELDGKPKYQFYKFVGSDFIYLDIDTRERVKFEGEDYDLYKNIVGYVQTKLQLIDKMFPNLDSTLNNPRYANINNLRADCREIPNARLQELIFEFNTFNNPADDGHVVTDV